jgi:hypothetical protein
MLSVIFLEHSFYFLLLSLKPEYLLTMHWS